MLVCLACPKQTQLPPTHDDHQHTTLVKPASTALVPSKDSIKSFTSQLKDIVMKFSSGAYRHCRPCTAAAVRGGVADEDNPILYEFEDEKSSILVGSNSEEQAMADGHTHRNRMLDEDESGTSTQLIGDSASQSSSRYDILPIARCNRLRRRKKKGISTSSTSSSLTLKQLPCNPDSCEAIEELLNAHFQREERILAEERSCANRRDDEDLLRVESCRADDQLLAEPQLVCKERRIEEPGEEQQKDGGGDGDVHVRGGKRHGKGEYAAAGKFEEWVAQVEPGVIITFVALHDGSNHLKRIRFSREMFSKWQAQLWWAENSEMVRELYSVSKSAAPFKSCGSARSSSSSSSTSSSSAASSLHCHALRNTPELQSRVGSCEGSPCQSLSVGIGVVENATCCDPQTTSSCVAHRSMSPSLGGLPHELMDHHENPLYNVPEFELCYNEGVKDSLMNQRDSWADGGVHSRKSQDAREDVVHADDPNLSAGGLVRELKRVRFIRQIPPSSN